MGAVVNQAPPLRLGQAHEHQGGGAIGDGAGIGRRDRAAVAEGRLQARDFVQVRRARLFVGVDDRLALSGFDRHRHDLPRRGAIAGRRLRPFQRADGEGILAFPGELEMLRRFLGEDTHQLALVIGIFQAVGEHVILHDAMAHAIAAARLGQQIGRIAHALHAAGDGHGVRSGGQQVVRQHGRLHARAAHLVHGCAADGLRNAGAERGLPGRCLAHARRQDAAEDHFAHLIRRDPGALQRSAYGDGAQLRRAHGRQFALKASHGRARHADDDDGILLCHDRSF
jgi:hypothetical protein